MFWEFISAFVFRFLTLFCSCYYYCFRSLPHSVSNYCCVCFLHFLLCTRLSLSLPPPASAFARALTFLPTHASWSFPQARSALFSHASWSSPQARSALPCFFRRGRLLGSSAHPPTPARCSSALPFFTHARLHACTPVRLHACRILSGRVFVLFWEFISAFVFRFLTLFCSCYYYCFRSLPHSVSNYCCVCFLHFLLCTRLSLSLPPPASAFARALTFLPTHASWSFPQARSALFSHASWSSPQARSALPCFFRRGRLLGSSAHPPTPARCSSALPFFTHARLHACTPVRLHACRGVRGRLPASSARPRPPARWSFFRRGRQLSSSARPPTPARCSSARPPSPARADAEPITFGLHGDRAGDQDLSEGDGRP